MCHTKCAKLNVPHYCTLTAFAALCTFNVVSHLPLPAPPLRSSGSVLSRPSRASLNSLLGYIGRSWGPFGLLWAAVVAILGCLGDFLVSFGYLLGAS